MTDFKTPIDETGVSNSPVIELRSLSSKRIDALLGRRDARVERAVDPHRSVRGERVEPPALRHAGLGDEVRTAGAIRRDDRATTPVVHSAVEDTNSDGGLHQRRP